MPDLLAQPSAAQPPPLVPPQGANIAPLLAQNQQQTDALLQQEQKQMQPAMNNVSSLLAQPRPQPPQMQPIPQMPDESGEQQKQAQEFLPIAIAFAGIAGALSRQHVTSALTAFGASIKGLQQGQMDVFNKKAKEAEDAAKQAIDTNTQKLAEYKAIMDDRKASLDEQMARIQMVALQYHDQLTADAAGAKNYLALGELMDRNAQAVSNFSVQVANLVDKQQQIYDGVKLGFEKLGFDLQEDGTLVPNAQAPAATLQKMSAQSAQLRIQAAGLPEGPKKQQLVDQADKIDAGVAKAKQAGGIGGAMSRIYSERVLVSAKEAAAALGNIVDLPMTINAPFWKGGSAQGPSILDASREYLSNKVTDQDAQAYNVMTSGLQRSLASIEAAGMRPPGSLSNQMEAVIIKPGDTQLTKLSKLAETRQIVEQGVSVVSSDPAVTPALKEQADEAVAAVKAAVPFTQQDVIRLMRAQDANPKVTLRQIMNENKGTPDGGTSGAAPVVGGGGTIFEKAWQ